MLPNVLRFSAEVVFTFSFLVAGIDRTGAAMATQVADSFNAPSAAPLSAPAVWPLLNTGGPESRTGEKPAFNRLPRIPGEFEKQKALVFSVSDWQPHHSHILRELVEKTHGHVDVLILHNDTKQLSMTLEWLKDSDDKCGHVHFCQMELDTIWLRDFAPLFAETESGPAAFDFLYEGSRPKDDSMPKRWCEMTGCQHTDVRWTMQGGNLLCNGHHLVVMTDRIFEDNYIRFMNPLPGMNVEVERRKIVTEGLTQACNIAALVILEPLQSEATRHADMFATFLAPDQIVVASVDPRRDPVNAAILDRNAKRLESVSIGTRPLQVHRLPIPPRDGKSWSAFTNAIIANDLLLMPIYDSDPEEMVQSAVRIYQELLPHHKIKTVDITTFKQLQGELHCLSVNLPEWAALPAQTITWQQAVETRKQTAIQPR